MPKPRTAADPVRDMLLDAEKRLMDLKGAGAGVLELVHLLDRIAVSLDELEAIGVDVRVERAQFVARAAKLRRKRTVFLSEAGASLRQERDEVQPGRDRWWWFLDEEQAKARRAWARKALTWTAVAAVVLPLLWFVYDRTLRPEPNVREAMDRAYEGERLVLDGDVEAALVEFEATVALVPDRPEYWLWLGIVHDALGEEGEAEAAFDSARARYEVDFDFFLARAQVYLRAADAESALADIERAILEDPEAASGYYVRSNIVLALGDYWGAVDDLEKAIDLAHEAGDAWLEGSARYQRATLLQQPPMDVSPVSTPEGEESDDAE